MKTSPSKNKRLFRGIRLSWWNWVLGVLNISNPVEQPITPLNTCFISPTSDVFAHVFDVSAYSHQIRGLRRSFPVDPQAGVCTWSCVMNKYPDLDLSKTDAQIVDVKNSFKE